MSNLGLCARLPDDFFTTNPVQRTWYKMLSQGLLSLSELILERGFQVISYLEMLFGFQFLKIKFLKGRN